MLTSKLAVVNAPTNPAPLPAQERVVLDALIEAAVDDYVVLSRVPLANLITPQMVLLSDSSQSEYADFVLCDKTTFSAKAIIQLNTKSKTFAQAALARGLQYIELDSQSSYDTALLRSTLQTALQKSTRLLEEASANSALSIARTPASQLN